MSIPPEGEIIGTSGRSVQPYIMDLRTNTAEVVHKPDYHTLMRKRPDTCLPVFPFSFASFGKYLLSLEEQEAVILNMHRRNNTAIYSSPSKLPTGKFIFSCSTDRTRDFPVGDEGEHPN